MATDHAIKIDAQHILSHLVWLHTDANIGANQLNTITHALLRNVVTMTGLDFDDLYHAVIQRAHANRDSALRVFTAAHGLNDNDPKQTLPTPRWDAVVKTIRGY